MKIENLYQNQSSRYFLVQYDLVYCWQWICPREEKFQKNCLLNIIFNSSDVLKSPLIHNHKGEVSGLILWNQFIAYLLQKSGWVIMLRISHVRVDYRIKSVEKMHSFWTLFITELHTTNMELKASWNISYPFCRHPVVGIDELESNLAF